MRELFTKPGQSKDDIGLVYTSISGAVGGMVFWTLTYPIDVVKSRIQVYNDKSNLINLMMRICRTEGAGALYNGLWPTLIRTIPATATLFVVYEYSKRYMHYVFRDF